jgi:Leucine-rich repeat (LRR) protein
MLEELNLDENPLQHWPLGLPETLQNFSANRSDLQTVESLPSQLQFLSLSSSRIRMLPTSLPESILFLDLHNNLLRNSRLPFAWGSSLRVLDLENNHLTKIPEDLPDSIDTLRLSNNNITEVPKQLPPNLVILTLNSNKLRKICIESRRKPIQVLSINDNELTESVSDYQQKKDIHFATNIREEENWNCEKHHRSAQKIRKTWRSYKLRRCLRSWRKTAIVKTELQQVSMHPCRAGRFEDISQMWGC